MDTSQSFRGRPRRIGRTRHARHTNTLPQVGLSSCASSPCTRPLQEGRDGREGKDDGVGHKGGGGRRERGKGEGKERSGKERDVGTHTKGKRPGRERRNVTEEQYDRRRRRPTERGTKHKRPKTRPGPRQPTPVAQTRRTARRCAPVPALRAARLLALSLCRTWRLVALRYAASPLAVAAAIRYT